MTQVHMGDRWVAEQALGGGDGLVWLVSHLFLKPKSQDCLLCLRVLQPLRHVDGASTGKEGEKERKGGEVGRRDGAWRERKRERGACVYPL